MRDRHVIFAALVCFLILVTAPVWYSRAAGVTAAGPSVTLPAHEKQCVMPVDYMRTSHMDLLVAWRDRVVREHQRSWTAPGGATYTISLSATCLKCHDKKDEFCDRCHDYAGVAPYCWDCHVDPAAIRRSTP
jgi:hypothetical protein